MDYYQILTKLRSLKSPKNREGMARYGINTDNALGISVYVIRKIAKDTGKNHELAQKLWDTEIHEARLLAGFISEPDKMTEKQMEAWVSDFDSWDTCDLICAHLFDRTKYAYKKVYQWTKRKEEFVKRAGFVLIAALAVHDKEAEDKKFTDFFKIIIRECCDERNFVKKAVNWALRNIGKRNLKLNKEAIKTAEEIKKIDSKTARWIASDALRELIHPKVQKRLNNK